jgi:hypothetical protein
VPHLRSGPPPLPRSGRCPGSSLPTGSPGAFARVSWFGFAAALLVLPGVGLHKFITEPNPDQLAPVLVVGSASALMLAWANWREK